MPLDVLIMLAAAYGMVRLAARIYAPALVRGSPGGPRCACTSTEKNVVREGGTGHVHVALHSNRLRRQRPQVPSTRAALRTRTTNGLPPAWPIPEQSRQDDKGDIVGGYGGIGFPDQTDHAFLYTP